MDTARDETEFLRGYDGMYGPGEYGICNGFVNPESRPPKWYRTFLTTRVLPPGYQNTVHERQFKRWAIGLDTRLKDRVVVKEAPKIHKQTTQNGFTKIYYTNGNLMYEGGVDNNNLKHGHGTLYSPQGVIIFIGMFEHGKRL